nr:hypothetical protein [Gaetbulibacter sp. 4G1]
MSNNKSRFLFFMLPLLFFLKKEWFLYSLLGKTFTILAISYSAYLGHSNLGIALLLLSLFLAFFFKNIYIVILLMVLSINVLYKISYDSYTSRKRGQDYTSTHINYERFFDPKIGVAAIYNYGIEKLNESYFIGVGYGNFSSRSGQLFESEITENIPKQMIKKWQPLFDTKAPYGLSSLFVLIVELGVFALIPIFFLLKWLNNFIRKGPFYLRAMTIYLFVIMNYNPTFFEYNESILYFLTLIIAYKLSNLNERNTIYNITKKYKL